MEGGMKFENNHNEACDNISINKIHLHFRRNKNMMNHTNLEKAQKWNQLSEETRRKEQENKLKEEAKRKEKAAKWREKKEATKEV